MVGSIIGGGSIDVANGRDRCLCNIRSDDSVPIRRLSQSYISNNTFQGIVEVFTQIR